MKIRGGVGSLRKMLARQLESLTMFESYEQNIAELGAAAELALQDMDRSLSFSNIKQTKDGGGTVFSPYHAGQYAQFLYWTARRIQEASPDSELCDMVSALNGYLHALFLNHRTVMPAIFYLDHPYGSVIGRAVIGDYFFAVQGVTVGAGNVSEHQVFPQLGDYVCMMAHSALIGNAHVGNKVILSCGCRAVNEDIPDNCIVFGQSPNLVIKQVGEERITEKIRGIWRC